MCAKCMLVWCVKMSGYLFACIFDWWIGGGAIHKSL